MTLSLAVPRIAADVRRGLTSPRKWLPPSLLYDAVGSALFEAITELSSYGITRAEMGLMRQHGHALAARCVGSNRIVELGCGDGRKARVLGGAFAGELGGIRYVGVDVSRYALERFTRELSDVAGVAVSTVQASFTAPERYLNGDSQVVALLGGTLGNFDPPARLEFLRSLHARMSAGDFLLLGLDLVKPEAALLDAYDDEAGVTAAFNRNVLVRINRECGANFDIRNFEHRAVWNAGRRRVEMHLRAGPRMTVETPGAECTVCFEPGETIHTESSYKFERGELRRMAEAVGFVADREWIDESWRFALCLWRRA